MDSPIRPDEFAKYAPRWLREGTAKPTGSNMPETQEEVVDLAEPPWRRPGPFDGDLRQWRVRQMPVPLNVPDESWMNAGLVDKLFTTAAVFSFAVIAMGGVGLLLFPNAPSEAFQAQDQSTTTTVYKTAVALQQDNAAIAPATDRAAAEADQSQANQGTDVASSEAATPAQRISDAMYVVASAYPKFATASQPQQLQVQVPEQPQALTTPVPPAQTAAPVPQAQTPPIPQQVQTAPVPQTQAFTIAPPPPMDDNTQAAPRRPVQQALSSDEIEQLTHRAEAFLAQGDITAARLLLERAAEAHDARAALTLGSTYDPNVLRSMGVVGIRPDTAQAHAWYERALEFGSGEAHRRLTALADLSR
jgi:TPR repeat protein